MQHLCSCEHQRDTLGYSWKYLTRFWALEFSMYRLRKILYTLKMILGPNRTISLYKELLEKCLWDAQIPVTVRDRAEAEPGLGLPFAATSTPGYLWMLCFSDFSGFRHMLESAFWQWSVLSLSFASFSPSYRIECHTTKSLKRKNFRGFRVFCFLGFFSISCQGKNTHTPLSLSSRQSRFFKRTVFNKVALE